MQVKALPFSRCVFAPELLYGTKKASKQIRGGGAPKSPPVRSETAPRYPSVTAGRGHGARRFWRTRSPSGALPRLSPGFQAWLGPVPRFFMAAPTDATPSATRAASSWQTGVVAGRASFRTARTGLRDRARGAALAPPSGSHPECALRQASGGVLLGAQALSRNLFKGTSALIQRHFFEPQFATADHRHRNLVQINESSPPTRPPPPNERPREAPSARRQPQR